MTFLQKAHECLQKAQKWVEWIHYVDDEDGIAPLQSMAMAIAFYSPLVFAIFGFIQLHDQETSFLIRWAIGSVVFFYFCQWVRGIIKVDNYIKKEKNTETRIQRRFWAILIPLIGSFVAVVFWVVFIYVSYSVWVFIWQFVGWVIFG